MARLPGFTKGVVSPDVGLRLGRERQGVGRIDGQRVDWLAVDQPVQQVEDVRLGRHASLQRQFHGSQYSLLVMLKNESQNLDHLAVAARRLEHALLQSAESRRQFGERRAVAQGSRFALNDRQIVPPIENTRCALAFVERAKTRACSQTICPSAATTTRSGSMRTLTGRLAKEAGTL